MFRLWSKEPVFIPLRLVSGNDVKLELIRIMKARDVDAATLLGAVGSISQANLRFANQSAGTSLSGCWEILSLSGTLSKHGLHLHMMIADEKGQCRGGHVLEGCIVHTTLELVIAVIPKVKFLRGLDPLTGHRELIIE